MTTWDKAVPPDLGRIRWWQIPIGIIRFMAVVMVTFIPLPVYILLKGLEKLGVLGRGPRAIIQWFWAQCCMRIFGLRLIRHGIPIKGGGSIVANHSSWLDIFCLRAGAHVAFVSKAEVRKWPVIGALAALTDTLFIERRSTQAKRQQIALTDRLERGDRLCFFPEGTSTDGLRVLPFKSALFGVFHGALAESGVGVQPVSVIYHAPPGLPENFYGWWGDMPFGKSIWDVATRSFGGRVELVFHDPLDIHSYADRKALSSAAERLVRDGFEARRLR